MTPITPEEAWDATNPNQTDEQRAVSAAAIMGGVAANDAYLNSRSELEQLKYLAQGAQVVSHAELNSSEEAPTVEGGTQTAIDSTAVEELPKLSPGGTSSASAAGHPGAENPEAAIAALRKQLSEAGITPEA